MLENEDVASDLAEARATLEAARTMLERVQGLESGEPLRRLVARLEEIAAGVERVEGVIDHELAVAVTAETVAQDQPAAHRTSGRAV